MPLRRPAPLALLALATTGLVWLGALGGEAQQLFPGVESSAEETAWLKLQQGRSIEAREQAERFLKQSPDSYVAHFVVAYVLHYNEADFPKALFHAQASLRSFEKRFGKTPKTGAPWTWHARILRELAQITGELEDHRARLAYIARFNELYEPDLIAEQAWTLMKLRRLPEARLAAGQGLASGDPMQKEVALNALCAIEFEAGNDTRSYEACQQAVEFGRKELGQVSAVDLTNAAEASRSLFRLEEAEKLLRDATEAVPSWYGNPWLELGALQLREGRIEEAAQSLLQMPGYRQQRPPHVRNSDQSEIWRVVGEALLMGGRAMEAAEMLKRAADYPDRRGHNSRDPAQDKIIALVMRAAALRAESALRRAKAADASLLTRVGTWFEAQWLGIEAWLSARHATALLLEENRLVDLMRIGSSGAAITPPWMVGELMRLVGEAPFERAINAAAAADKRAAIAPYIAAFRAELAWSRGETERFNRFYATATTSLPPQETLLRHRLAARRAALGDTEALHRLARELPIFLPLFNLSLPVRLDAASSQLDRAPFLISDAQASFAIQARGTGHCIFAGGGSQLACGAASKDALPAISRFFDAWVARRLAGVDLEAATTSGSRSTDTTAP